MSLPAERWLVSQDSVRLQLLTAGEGDGVPLLFVPGTPAPAADFLPDMEALAPRPTAAVSLRGHVPSDAPDTGYRLEEFVADLGTTVEALSPARPVLLGFSMATAYVLAYALRHPERVSGLILVDCPARTAPMPAELAERILASAPPEFFRPAVVRGLQRDSRAVDLYPDLGRLTCPVLIMQGGKGSRLSEADLARYREKLPRAEVAAFPESGHDVRRPDRERFTAVIAAFLDRVRDGE